MPPAHFPSWGAGAMRRALAHDILVRSYTPQAQADRIRAMPYRAELELVHDRDHMELHLWVWSEHEDQAAEELKAMGLERCRYYKLSWSWHDRVLKESGQDYGAERSRALEHAVDIAIKAMDALAAAAMDVPPDALAEDRALEAEAEDHMERIRQAELDREASRSGGRWRA